MSRREKLVERIRARPPEADFSDVRALLEEFGWQQQRQKGSHITFGKEGEFPIILPLVSGRKVKRVYLDKIIERLGLEE